MGAPILEFSATVVTSDDDDDDYEPVTINLPDYIQDNIAEASDFDGDIDVIINENIETETVTVTIENKPEDVYSYTK